MKIIFDGEMGGIGIDKSLLTMYFMVIDDQGNKVDDLYLKLRPKDGVYKVEAQGLRVNKINLVDHDQTAITYEEGGTLLYNFLQKNTTLPDRLVPVGHGFSGDLDQIFDKLVRRPNWEKFVSYRRLDTQVVVQFLKETGHIPDTISGGLDSMVEYFKIEISGPLHDAKTDTLATWELFKKLKELVDRPRTIVAGPTNLNDGDQTFLF